MINISNTLKERLKHDYAPYNENPVHKDLTISFTNPVLTIDNSMRKADTFSLDQCICDSETIQFGGCKSSVLKFVACGVSDNIKGRECTVKLSIENEVINLGIYIVDSVNQTADVNFKEVVAYDRMHKFDQNVANWYNSFSWTSNKTLKNLRDSLCSYIGVSQETIELVNDSMLVEKTISAEIINGIDVLRSICELNGVFGVINELGVLTYVSLDNSVIEDLDDYKTLTHDECDIDVIDKLQIRAEEGDIGAIAGTGTNCYVIQGNFLVAGKSAEELQTIATNLSSKILGITYRPFEYDGYGLPFLQVGDSVQFNGYTSYILKRTLSGVQCLKDLYSAKGTKQIEVQKGVNVDIKQLKSKTNILVRTVEEMNSKISEKIGEDYLGIFPSTSIFPSTERFPCENTQYTLMLQEFSTRIHQTSREIVLAAEELENEIANKTAALSIRSDQIESTVNDLTTNTSTSITQLSNEVNIRVKRDEVVNQINVSSQGINLSGNRVEIHATNFDLDPIGNMECKNGKFSGQITGNGLFTGDGQGNSILIKDGLIHAKTQYQSDWISYFCGMGCSVPTVYCDALWLGNTNYSDTTLLTTDNYADTLDSVYASSVHDHGTKYADSVHAHDTLNDIIPSMGESQTYIGAKYLRFIGTSGDENIPSIGWVKMRQDSDERLKDDIRPLLDMTERYMRIQPVSYRFKEHVNDDTIHYGFIAQDIEKIYPNSSVVEYDEEIKTKGERIYIPGDDGVYRINDRELHALHVQMIQKQQKEIEELKQLVNSLIERK